MPQPNKRPATPVEREMAAEEAAETRQKEREGWWEPDGDDGQYGEHGYAPDPYPDSNVI